MGLIYRGWRSLETVAYVLNLITITLWTGKMIEILHYQVGVFKISLEVL